MKSLALAIHKCKTLYLIRVAPLFKAVLLATSSTSYPSSHCLKKQPFVSNPMLMLSLKPLAFFFPYLGIIQDDLADEASRWRERVGVVSTKVLGGGQKVRADCELRDSGE